LHAAAHTSQGGTRQRPKINTIKKHLAAIGFLQPQHQPPDRTFARARLADEPEHLSALQLEADIVDRTYDAGSAPQRTIRDREELAQMLDRQDWCGITHAS
jgi:hypothetical protein